MNLTPRSPLRFVGRLFHWMKGSHCFATYSPPISRSPALSTLKPDELLPWDFMDMSKKTAKYIYFAKAPRVPISMQPRLWYYGANGRFPDHARGFLYLHNPPDMPLIASAIRLRCTPSKDPATFNQGKDLELPYGIPWEFTFPSILFLRSPYIRDYLVQAGLLTEDLLSHWRSVLRAVPRGHTRILHQLNQPFLIKFHHYDIRLPVAVPDFIGTLHIHAPFQDRRTQLSSVLPYKGSAFARLELSTLPGHSDKRAVVMRIIKFAEPVTCTIPDYDGWLPFPKEGELFHRVTYGSQGRALPYAIDIDKDAQNSRVLKYMVEGSWTSPASS